MYLYGQQKDRKQVLFFFSHYKDDLKQAELPEREPQKAAVLENQIQDQTLEKNAANNSHSANLTLFLQETDSKHKKSLKQMKGNRPTSSYICPGVYKEGNLL